MSVSRDKRQQQNRQHERHACCDIGSRINEKLVRRIAFVINTLSFAVPCPFSDSSKPLTGIILLYSHHFVI